MYNSILYNKANKQLIATSNIMDNSYSHNHNNIMNKRSQAQQNTYM